jgi:beta-aspartyl-peptidase (threonine type)
MDRWSAATDGARRAAQLGREVLARGGDCVDAAVVAVRELEDDPAFNAGHGACMNEEGGFEVDAGIMRSSDGRSGAVGAVPNLADAILVARTVMERSRHNLLCGHGVRDFAETEGVGTFSAEACWSEKAQRRFESVKRGEAPGDNRADTVGAVALDAHGHLCAAVSTGGVLLKTPGRVGDTPLIGSGFYADDRLGAMVATGVGEALMARVASYACLARALQSGDLQRSADEMCLEIRGTDGPAAGVIGISGGGKVVVSHACDHMSWAIAGVDGELRSGLVHPARS